MSKAQLNFFNPVNLVAKTSQEGCDAARIKEIVVEPERKSKTSGRRYVPVTLIPKPKDEKTGETCIIGSKPVRMNVFLYDKEFAMPFRISSTAPHLTGKVGIGVDSKFVLTYEDEEGQLKVDVIDRPFSEPIRKQMAQEAAAGKYKLAEANNSAVWILERAFWSLNAVICLKLIEDGVLDEKQYDKRQQERLEARNRDVPNNQEGTQPESEGEQQKEKPKEDKKDKSKGKKKNERAAKPADTKEAADSTKEEEVPADGGTIEKDDVPFE